MKRRGNCYVACEALFHLLGGYASGWHPRYVKHEGDTHWYLLQKETNLILDPTSSQFKTKPDYTKSKGCGFLTNHPSKRARELMEKIVWQKLK